MSGGFLGELFAALSFSGALVATISYLFAAKTPRDLPEKSGWQFMANFSFWLHSFSVIGIISTLFYLIYTHQYQYHYVWSHSSNELPVYYMISCFWEGQEGSFLLWTFWHVVLGLILMRRAGEWRDVVMGVISAVNLILASMVLGINLDPMTAQIVMAVFLALIGSYLARQLIVGKDSIQSQGMFHYGGLLLLACTGYLVFSEKAGQFSLTGEAAFSMDGIGYLVMMLGVLAYAGLLIWRVLKVKSEGATPSALELLALVSVAGIAFTLLKMPMGEWKVGSSPFILLRDAMQNAPVFASNPDFVPANGSGLNPLLQNYWMVIHPPTLFLGFASTVVPFAFVVGGLINGKTTEWLRPATPWAIFSVMILGVGIIMGGYWAYETLNFGGYWNWDPVENSSLVPWLLGIAAVHAMIAYRKSKLLLGFTMWLVISVFIFVLYSTFLTRSGILGEASVHTFTDLGLSGQLLILLFAFLFGIGTLYIARSGSLPTAKKTMELKSAEFLLFLGVFTLLALSVIVTIATSVPVFNKILGTSWATPVDGAFFYYRWTVWLAVLMAVLSGLAQFVFWRKLEKKRVRAALLRPYMAAIVVALLLIMAVMLGTDWEFVFQGRFAEWRELAEMSGNPVQTILRYIRLFFFLVADKFLLVASLFMVFANLDLMIRLLRKSTTRKVTGGTIAHVGFGLMLLGMLYSAGYDQVISRNVNPAELSALPQDRRTDNVLLQKGKPRDIMGYQVTYIGKKEAVAPISDLEVIENDGGVFKVRFEDATGDVFAQVMPLDVFMNEQMVLDMPKVEAFLNEKLDFLKPQHINNRSLYGLRFVPRIDNPGKEPILREEKAFVLYPEAEVNEQMGLVAHPSRKITLQSDIYAHVSTVPKDEEPKFKYYKFDVHPGDTMQTTRAMVLFEKVVSVPSTEKGIDYVLQANLKVMTDWGKIFELKPEFRIDTENNISVKEDYCEEIYTSFIFANVDPEKKVLSFQAQELQNPPDDIVVIQVLKKPWINFLWLGTFVVTIGFIVAMVRRIRESRKGITEETDAA